MTAAFVLLLAVDLATAFAGAEAPLAAADALVRESAGDRALASGDPAAAARHYEGLAAASALRNLARARLRLGELAAARTAAARSLEVEYASADGRSLLAWCEARARLTPTRRDEVGSVVSELGPDVARRVAERVTQLRKAYERVVPQAADGFPPVYVLTAATFTGIAPDERARGFYQRDEQAVFVIGEKEAELDRLLGHECFHAHLHRHLENAPAWLDEGFADWFAAAPDPHPIRLRDLQVAYDSGREVRFAELARLDRRGMYDGEGIYLRFAAAWGFVHYLRAKEPARLDRYVAMLLAGGSSEEAYVAGFGDMDVVAFESRVRAYILALPLR